MRFQKIETAIWNDEKFCTLTPMQQRLWLYLLTCPHGNLAGIFVLKEGYALGDLKYSRKDYRKDFSKLLEMGSFGYDEESNTVWIRNFLKYNPITNPNQKKSFSKALQSLPKSPLVSAFIRHNQGLIAGLPEVLREGLDEGLRYTEEEVIYIEEKKKERLREGLRPPAPSAGKISDEEWLEGLKGNPAYQGMDIDRILGKCQAWCTANGKQFTRQRFVNWLNREERPIMHPGKKPSRPPKHCNKCDKTHSGECDMGDVIRKGIREMEESNREKEKQNGNGSGDHEHTTAV
jgi:hypothetical protein